MADDTAVTRDPSKKRFWTARNISLLVLTAVVPAMVAGVWDKASVFLVNHNAMEQRLAIQEALIKEVDERLEDKAVWKAISDQRNAQVKLEIQVGVLQKLFDREFCKPIASVTAPTTPPSTPPKPPASQKDWEELLEKWKKMEPYSPEQLREALERQNPKEPLRPNVQQRK